jgi:YVTN family beta-propeller protein
MRKLLILALASSSAAFGSGIALTPDGATLLVANPDSGSVSAVDTRTLEKIAETHVGGDPRGLSLSPDGRFLYVACQSEATAAVLQVRPLRLLASIPVGAEPYDIVADQRGRLLYVTSSATAAVAIVAVAPTHVRPGHRPAQLLNRVVDRIAVSPRPKGLALSNDGTRLYVTHFLTGEISVIDTARREVTRVISTGLDSNMAQRIVLHSGGDRAYVPHVRSRTIALLPMFDDTVFPMVSVVDLVTGQLMPQERLDLSLDRIAVNLPFDVAFSRDGRYAYVVGLGSGDFSMIDLQTRRRVDSVDVGDGPRGIALAPDGLTAYVTNSLSGDVSVIDLPALRERYRVRVTTSPLPADVQRGKVLFFSSRSTETSRDRWLSCASCHFEGDHDGRTWFTRLGPRNTPSLRGVSDTRPLHWSGDRDEIQDFEFTIRDLQEGTGLVRGRAPNMPLGPPNGGLSADLDALAAFVNTLRPKANPLAHDKAAVERGRAVFERADVGCAVCHVPPRYTDSTLGASIVHEVGTGDGPDEHMGPAFDTPSLRALWDSAPYLHNGSAPTLRDVLITRNPADRHGRTSQLSDDELRDLIAFLMSL